MAGPASDADAVPLDKGTSPFRQCAVTRAERPIAALIRYVAGPDDRIVPDLAAKLPGRGVWVTATRDSTIAAVRQNAFAKSLKRKVQVDPELPALVERLLGEQARSAFSFARKAGLVITGFAKVDAAIGDGGVIALLHASDASADGSAKLDRRLRAIAAARGRVVVVMQPFTSEEMSLALGRDNVVHAALTEGGTSRKFLSQATRLGRYRRSLDFDATEDEPATPFASGPSMDTA